MRRRFVTLDVFTTVRFAGNPLAVVLDADGLDIVSMQAIAREFNLSETVFVSPPGDAAHRAALRIFTPAAEIPFAGHPTVGTAVLLALIDGAEAGREFVLEERVGPVRCVCTPSSRDGGHARFAIPRLPGGTETSADKDVIASALGLKAGEIGFDGKAPEAWSAGNAFTFVPLRGLDAIRRGRPNLGTWDAAFGGEGHVGVFVFCRETAEPGNHFHARMFAPTMGVPEDPATGSAAAAMAGWIARHLELPDGTHDFRIEQGYEMGRPSLIELRVATAGGKLSEAWIGGHAVVVSEGQIEA
jgi:trans-2,3-dihydro-3-hydroxyanthranilate isomerase